jgi:hypothetical protein
MGNYSSNKFLIPNGLDEIGLRLGLHRFDFETLGAYRRRLLLEARERSGPTQFEFIRSLNRRVGQFDIPFLDIGLLLDSNNVPLAPDPYIEITSTHFRAYSDYGGGVLDIELNLVDRDEGYFLRDVVAAFVGSTSFSLTIIDTNHTYKLSSHLRYDNSNRFVRSEFLLESRSNKLAKSYVREIYPEASFHFQEEVLSLALVDGEGKYYVDYTSGVVFTYEPARGIIAYTHREFPFRLWWQSVRPWPYNDDDYNHLHKDVLVSDATGLEEHLLLNSEGAKIANEILALHPLGWGE